MATCLNSLKLKFEMRLKVSERAFERHIVEPCTNFQTDRFALQEGLVSRLWQIWNAFCRDITLASVKGAKTTSGANTTSPYSANTEKEILYIASKLSKSSAIGTIKEIGGSHLEPTWGDISKLNLIISGIGTSNSSNLLSSFGVANRISDLQLCRNTCAHINPETLNKLAATHVRYTPARLRHPSDFIYWEDPLTRDYIWRTWIDEMETISDFAIQ